jgi:hypothetical protein
MQGSNFGQVSQGLLTRCGSVWIGIGTIRTVIAGDEPQTEGFIGSWIQGNMQIAEQRPILFGAPPGKRPSHGVAVRAGALYGVVGNVGLIYGPALGIIIDRRRLGRSQAMIGGQILENGTRFFRSQPYAAHPLHPFHRLLPAFWRGALPGYSREIPMLVLLVATATFGDHQLVSDGDTLFGR